MHDLDDWELVAQTQAGNTQAFAELVRRYQAPVIHFCQRMVGSAQEAEDLAQESFIRVYRHIGRLAPKAKFSTVLFGIARNLALNALRDARRQGRNSAQSLEEQLVEPAASAETDRRARLKEIESALAKGIARLSPEHREILLLREMQGMEYDEIAKALHCRKGTVRSRLARAREQLRLRLVELGGDWL
ncbi:MAG TPA: sigma-70 family RNA polymerase sigma factor [Candidatus Hydrogenedentes bacterium]|nr:sigma-70 family RNA polymerase sigma factor [Candidatus Hydrogenedentota bacterium]